MRRLRPRRDTPSQALHDTIGGLAVPHLDTPADAQRAGQHLVNIRVQSFDPGETIAAFFYRNWAFGVITQSSGREFRDRSFPPGLPRNR